MSDYQLTAEAVGKTFGRRLIFKDVNFSFENQGTFGIAGHNGSGKSTLVKIITGILGPSKGTISHLNGGSKIPVEKLHDYIGFVAPYLVLYDEFSAEENLRHFANIRGVEYNKERIDYLFNAFLLYDRRLDEVKAYSSGMKQRLKYIFALMHSPKLLVLDEPTSNLDSAGKDTVYKLIEAESASAVVLIASNEESDLALCKSVLQLENYKNNSK
ncbi:MAG: ABC transporter ATP-binding protein [Ignavibacteria bacterium]|jgi:heme exporter protein A|nr:ABC transporter ATP-binding protein [Ignavibacteria bacterium]MCU7500633.1 ABC transporter ATP-binding protein [Ignavibacteria bacterium]MCU7519616.1 ABC transporter ATP-binding protein [Ignavibacteria bacterium]MCU7525639.1 ABC transporter ATP-binding protein [Ignavibacteria bacterium]